MLRINMGWRLCANKQQNASITPAIALSAKNLIVEFNVINNIFLYI